MTARYSKPDARKVQFPSSLMNLLFSKPFSYLFFLTLLLGIFIAISASNWFIVWIGLELNLYSFVPLLILSKSNQEKEASIKYFITQALASALLLFSSLIITFSVSGKLSIIVALFIKLGLAPFHFWLPSVINSISWSMCWILTTLQKIAPMVILIFSSYLSFLTVAVAIVRGLIGGLGGLAQTQLRAIFAYSSISHIAWILSASILSSTLSVFYFLSYILIVSSIIVVLILTGVKSLKVSLKLNKNVPIQIILVLSILRLRGMPPLFGFFPKVLVILAIVKTKIFLLCAILLIRSSINLYFYRKILMGFFFMSPVLYQWTGEIKIRIKLFISVIFSLTFIAAIVCPIIIPYLFYALTLFYKP